MYMYLSLSLSLSIYLSLYVYIYIDTVFRYRPSEIQLARMPEDVFRN